MKLLASIKLAADASTQKLDKLGEAIYKDSGGAAAHSDVIGLVGGLIKAAISILGVIFVCLTVYAGFLWMNARGDEKMVEKAKDTLMRAVIGLVIVIASYAITSFVLSRVVGATATPAA